MVIEKSTPTPVIPRAAVSVAIFRDDTVLLIKRGKPPAAGLWSLPGGHIEPGEFAIDAVRRELFEETSLTAEIFGVSGVKDVVHRDDRSDVLLHRVIIVFFGRATKGEPRAGSDAAAVRWQGLGALGELPATEGLAAIVADAAERLAALGKG